MPEIALKSFLTLLEAKTSDNDTLQGQFDQTSKALGDLKTEYSDLEALKFKL